MFAQPVALRHAQVVTDRGIAATVRYANTVLSVDTQPVAGLQLSSVHRLPSLQFGGGPPPQMPPPHVSDVVHASLSSQATTFATA